MNVDDHKLDKAVSEFEKLTGNNEHDLLYLMISLMNLTSADIQKE